MGAWQNSNLSPDVADFIERASIRTAFIRGDLLAENTFAQMLVVGLQFRLSRFVVFRNRGLQPLLEFFNQIVAIRLGVLFGIQAIGEICSDALLRSS